MTKSVLRSILSGERKMKNDNVDLQIESERSDKFKVLAKNYITIDASDGNIVKP